jgi:hypothetical protein
MDKRKNRFGSKPDAVFVGWQETNSGTRVALFNITADEHPSYGSTVSEETLRNHDLMVPRIPPPEGDVNEISSSKNEREMREE